MDGRDEEIARLKAEVARLEPIVEDLEIQRSAFEWQSEQRLKKIDELRKAEYERYFEAQTEAIEHAPGRRYEVPRAVIDALQDKFSFDEIMNKGKSELVAGIQGELNKMNHRTLRRHVDKALKDIEHAAFAKRLKLRPPK
jgi:hypothetical protein